MKTANANSEAAFQSDEMCATILDRQIGRRNVASEIGSGDETSNQECRCPRCLPSLSGNLCEPVSLWLPHGLYAASTKRNTHFPIPFGMVARERDAGRHPAGSNSPNEFPWCGRLGGC